MKYLSVCAGIEAATVAWHPLGWEPVAFSEIEKFPSNVLAHHYPDVPNYGDMTDHEKWPEANLDVLVGGTPCQSFSVAGLRQGMADPRGNLALVYLAIAEQYRPTWLVWENVPGVLSSNEGKDFSAIIGGMVELGYSPTWRVLDAQYFGVAQRRRRVFIVASSGDWTDSAKVLLEPESLRGNPAPRRETQQEVANCLTDRPDRGGGNSEGQRLIPEIARTLTNTSMTADYSDGTPGNTIPWPAEVAATMNARFADKQGLEDQHALGGASYFVPDTMGTMTARMMNALGSRDIEEGAVMPLEQSGEMAVRRLTPLECERLQGFPDNYTNIPGASDSARYKALGNSMAVPVMHWIGKRIEDSLR